MRSSLTQLVGLLAALVAGWALPLGAAQAEEASLALTLQRGHDSWRSWEMLHAGPRWIVTASESDAVLWERGTGRVLARTASGVTWKAWRAIPERDLLVGVGQEEVQGVFIAQGFRLSTLEALPAMSARFSWSCELTAIDRLGERAACGAREQVEIAHFSPKARVDVLALSGAEAAQEALPDPFKRWGSELLLLDEDQGGGVVVFARAGMAQESVRSVSPEGELRYQVSASNPRDGRRDGTLRWLSWVDADGQARCGTLESTRGALSAAPADLCEAEAMAISEASGLVVLRDPKGTIAVNAQAQLLWRSALPAERVHLSPNGARAALIAPDTGEASILDARHGQVLETVPKGLVLLLDSWALRGVREDTVERWSGGAPLGPAMTLGSLALGGGAADGDEAFIRTADGVILLKGSGAPLILHTSAQHAELAWFMRDGEALGLGRRTGYVGSARRVLLRGALGTFDLNTGDFVEDSALRESIVDMYPRADGALLRLRGEGSDPLAWWVGGRAEALRPLAGCATPPDWVANSFVATAGDVWFQHLQFNLDLMESEAERWLRLPAGADACAPAAPLGLGLSALSESGDWALWDTDLKAGGASLCLGHPSSPEGARCGPPTMSISTWPIDNPAYAPKLTLTRDGALLFPQGNEHSTPAGCALHRTTTSPQNATPISARWSSCPDGLRLSPDDQRLALLWSPKRSWGVGDTPHIRVLDAQTGAELARIETRALNAHFSPDKRHLVTTHPDGAVRLWDANSGALLLTLVLFQDGAWVVIDPEGRFDRSPGAGEGLHFVLKSAQGLESIGLDQLEAHFYEPDLLAKTLDPARAPRPLAGFNARMAPPQVRWTQSGQTLDVELIDRGGGLGRVALFIGQREVAPDVRPATLPAQGGVARFQVNLAPYAEFISSEALPRLEAWTANDTVASRGGAGRSASPIRELGAGVDLFAVVVAVHEYEDPSLNLSYTEADARDMARALRAGGRALLGPYGGEVQVTELSTRAEADARPSLESLRATLAQIQGEAGPEDMLVVYFSGHGVSRDAQWLYPWPEATSMDLNASVIPAKRALSQATLMELLRPIPAQKVFLILDTCEAGAALEGGRSAADAQARAMMQLRRSIGTTILAAAPAGRRAYEDANLGHGLLTYALLEGLSGAAPLEQGRYWEVSTLAQYAATQVPKITEAVGISDVQRPAYTAPEASSGWWFGAQPEDLAIELLPLNLPMLTGGQLMHAQDRVDSLDLQPLLRRALYDLGPTAGLRWTPELGGEGVWRLGGSYQTDGGTLTLTLTLLGPDGERATTTLTGAAPEPLMEQAARWAACAVRQGGDAGACAGG